MKPNYVKVVPMSGEAIYARSCQISLPLNQHSGFIYFTDPQGIERKMIEFDSKDMREIVARAIQAMFDAKQKLDNEEARVIYLDTEEFIKDLEYYMRQVIDNDEKLAIEDARRTHDFRTKKTPSAIEAYRQQRQIG